MLSRFVLFLRPRAAAVRRLLNNQAEHCSRDMSTKASGLNGLSRSLLRMIVTPGTHVSQHHQHQWDNQHCTSLFELDQSSTRALALPDFHQGGSASRFPGSQTLSICTSSHPGRLPRVTRSQVGAAPSPRARVRPTARLPCEGGGGGRASHQLLTCLTSASYLSHLTMGISV